MLILPAAAALSPLRFRRQQESLARAPDAPALLRCGYVHIVDTDTGKPVDARLASLLQPAATPLFCDEAALRRGHWLYVAPRAGTISPWSSKATDIARRCGFDGVRRVERIVAWEFDGPVTEAALGAIAPAIHDRMIETVLRSLAELPRLFETQEARRGQHIDILEGGREALETAGWRSPMTRSTTCAAASGPGAQPHRRRADDVRAGQLGALPAQDLQRRLDHRRRRPGAEPVRDDPQHAPSPGGRALGLRGQRRGGAKGMAAGRFVPPRTPASTATSAARAPADEGRDPQPSHGHCAVSRVPVPASAARSATRAPPVAAPSPRPASPASACPTCAFPGASSPGRDNGKAGRIASALDIMLEGPIGGAAFNNEFGRPNLCGYFRSFEQQVSEADGEREPARLPQADHDRRRLRQHRAGARGEAAFAPGHALLVLGGPAMLIGLGGGAASSMASADGQEDLDFASVQRQNPEMERRCQEVIDRCWQLGRGQPHRLHPRRRRRRAVQRAAGAGQGRRLRRAFRAARDVPCDDPRHVAAGNLVQREPGALRAGGGYRTATATSSSAICERERCPWPWSARPRRSRASRVDDREFGDAPVDMPMPLLFGKPPRLSREVARHLPPGSPCEH
jgi:phosphoribosylformylglycinamidine synthase